MAKFGKPIYQPMTEANFIALAQKRYAALQALNKIDNFYDSKKSLNRYGESWAGKYWKVI